jgi:hypothetical protein
MKKPRALVLFAWLGVVAWGSPAGATPDFPGAVETYLNLPSGTLASKIFASACNCNLCHVSCTGGLPLTEFGQLMQANGAVPFQGAQTAGPALAGIQAQEPQLIMDLQNGIDPNSDPSLSGGVQYGCQAVPEVSGAGAAGVLAGLLAFGVAARRRLRRS